MLVLAACVPKQEQPQPEVPPSPATAPQAGEPAPSGGTLSELDALEHDLATSEARLEAELEKKSAAPTAGESPPRASNSAADSAASEVEGSAQREEPASAPARERVGSPCDLSCRALGSMRRAQTKICEIAGSGPRCQRAIDRVQTAAQRVHDAGCECHDEEVP